MTKKEKDLLLKDLCARLPYGVKVYFEFEPDIGEKFESHGILESINNYSQVEIDSNKLCGQLLSLEYNKVKPYLFPLSSMTKEQRKECFEGTPLEIDKYGDVAVKDDFYGNSHYTDLEIYLEVIDWLNKNHFDYMGLIEKELAINAVGLNIY